MSRSESYIFPCAHLASDSATKSLLDIVEKNLKRAQRDNDLIYHQDVPPLSTLPPIAPTPMVRLVIPPTVQEPKSAVGNEPVLFADLLCWGARTAIGMALSSLE